MAREIKLKNDAYISTAGITHNRVPLDEIIDYWVLEEDGHRRCNVNMSGYAGYWCRITTQVFTGRFSRLYGRILVDNDGYEPAMADIWLSFYSQNEPTSSSPFNWQAKVLAATGGFSYSNSIAVTIEGKGTSSCRVSLWILERYNYSSMKIWRMYGSCDIKNYTRATSLPGEIIYLN